ncbi:hypothetical protein GQX74_007415 [Glossina fuscipes]|nr:hypothetical protein GQX74_007415 [Glossina fuscipes]
MLCDLSCCSCQKCKRYRDIEKDSDIAINFERWNACSRSNQQSDDMSWNQTHSDDRPWLQPQSGDRPCGQTYADDRLWRRPQSDDRQWSPSQSDDRSKFQNPKDTVDLNPAVHAQMKANGRKSFEADNPLTEPDSSNLPSTSIVAAPAFIRNVLPEAITSLVQGPSVTRESSLNSNFMPNVQNVVRDSIRANLPNFLKNSIDINRATESKFMPSILRKLNSTELSGGSEPQSTSFGGIFCDIVGAMATTQVIVLSLIFLLTLNVCFQVMMHKRGKNMSSIRANQKVKQTSPCKDKGPTKTEKSRKSSDVPTEPFSPCKFLKRNLPRQSGGACEEKKKEEKKANSFLSFLRGPRCRTTCPPGTPKTYSFCAKFAENCPQREARKYRRYKQANKAVNTPMTDCQGKEIYKIYEKHSYPLDMKFPPAPFIYIRDCILRRMCPRSPEETEREDCV